MTKEEQDFIYFESNQLEYVDFETGRIDTGAWRTKNGKNSDKYWRVTPDAGSLNEDGYVRIWCNGTLRMKHRLLYWLWYHELPEEIDHIDHDRSNNSILNLRSVDRSENNKGIKFNGRRKFTEEEIHNICKDIQSDKYSDNSLAEKYDCNRITIMGIRSKYRHADIASQYF